MIRRATRRPVVGIVSCLKTPAGENPFYRVDCKYVDAVVDVAQCTPLVVPPIGARQDVDDVLSVIDGLLFTGSPSNIEPGRYGQVLSVDEHFDTERDATSLPLLAAAIERQVPFFGICRGMQELNVHCGGTLHQAIHDQPGFDDHRVRKEVSLDEQYGQRHRVNLVAGSRLQAIYGGRDAVEVNSLHGQGVSRVGRGLKVEALSPDGVVEALCVETSDTFQRAVQWHPEWRAGENPDYAVLFEVFGAACGAAKLRMNKR
ncbi:gamma-glutamyl-gamma-aminobutyrate hydrolase family protein [Ramlibacter monticola]|uniref:gamma-glutamyl-gamma-aminobutyrate hydrolase n=1 Tax=Ramlibacter monticola TaxID=1926872 RepID=A0A937CUD1_9BURK|nr:gamma-glutamyl-gamma-aminobutyrate hydrolase family protein [Ramlibacter monticola]MBL0393241.1 gamma-glutamyl-gamma-aminobutyrate hydrolase family protein [Ramlibacter monticola]